MVCVTVLDDATTSGFKYKYLASCSPSYSTVHGQSNIVEANRYSKFINLILSIGSPSSFVFPGSLFTRVDVSLYNPIIGSEIYSALVDSVTYHTPMGDVRVNRISDIDAYIDVVNQLEAIDTILVNADVIKRSAKAIYDALRGINNVEAKRDARIIAPLTRDAWINVIEKYRNIPKYTSSKVNLLTRERTRKEVSELNLSPEFIESHLPVSEVKFSVSDFEVVDASIIIRDKFILVNASDGEIFRLLLGEYIGGFNPGLSPIINPGLIADVLSLAFNNIGKQLSSVSSSIVIAKPENISLINHLLAAVIRLIPCLFMSPDKAIERLGNISCEGNQFIISVLDRVRQLIRIGKCDEAYEYINKELIGLGI